MDKLGPLLLLLLAGAGLVTDAPAGWPLGPAGWKALAVALLLGGVLGLLHLSSNYLPARFVGFAWRLTRSDARANAWYFRVMRPGVIVHELAHALAAAAVGGRVLQFNVLESSVQRGGRVRLGHVTYQIPGDPRGPTTRLKDALVGLAPLLLGLLLIGGALAGSGVDWAAPLARGAAPLRTWQFWLALVAIVEVADQMTPSSADRRNWPSGLLLLAAASLLVWAALRVLAVEVPLGWWAGLLQGGLILAEVLLVPVALNLLCGGLLWLLAHLVRR